MNIIMAILLLLLSPLFVSASQAINADVLYSQNQPLKFDSLNPINTLTFKSPVLYKLEANHNLDKCFEIKEFETKSLDIKYDIVCPVCGDAILTYAYRNDLAAKRSIVLSVPCEARVLVLTATDDAYFVDAFKNTLRKYFAALTGEGRSARYVPLNDNDAQRALAFQRPLPTGERNADELSALQAIGRIMFALQSA